MKLTPLLARLAAASWLAACGGCSSSATPDGSAQDALDPAAITITITSDKALALVAFREGLDGPWQPAAMKTPTVHEAHVHGPYVVAAVCEDPGSLEFQTFQEARTPDDERTIMIECLRPGSPRHPVTGRMVQAGRVRMADGFDDSPSADWTFSVSVPLGTHELVATTADRIALRRGIAVGGSTTVTPDLDLAQEGAALAEVAFTASNAVPGELLDARVELDLPGPGSFNIYGGPIAAAKVAPDSVLAATDVQSVSLGATSGVARRSLRRPFRVGGATAYTLPPPIEDVRWEIAGGDLTMSWSALPAFDSFRVSTIGVNAPRFRSQSLHLSPRFVAATGLERATIDTNIPGYRPAWRVPFSGYHTRSAAVQRAAGDELATSSIDETHNLGSP